MPFPGCRIVGVPEPVAFSGGSEQSSPWDSHKGSGLHVTEGPCASLAFCRGLDLELLVEDLWGAGSALQGPPGLRLAGPEGRCGPRRSHARHTRDAQARWPRHRGRTGQRVGRFGVASAQCHGARVVRCDPPHTVTPAPCTRQGRKRGPLAGVAVTSRSAESGTWGRGRARQAGLQTRESRRQRLAAPARSGHRSYRCM